MRQNLSKARAAQRRDGMGPIYQRLLDFERGQDRKYGHMRNGMRRPRYLLDALEAGETVEVPVWRVPVELRPSGCGSTLVVTPDM